VDPGAVLSQVDKFEEILVETGSLTVLSEKGFMGAGGAGGHNHPVEIPFLDPFSNGRQTVLGAGVEVALGMFHVRQCPRIVHHIGDIHNAADVGAAVANENADSHGF
jgi:hypothetical protein